MDLYKRSEAVVEIQLYHRTNESDLSTSCHHRAKVDPHITYTLVKMRPSPVGCPLSLSGVFLLNVPLLSSHKSHVGKCAPESEEDENPNRQHFLEIGCSRRGSGLDFYSACNHGQPLVPTKGLQLVSGKITPALDGMGGISHRLYKSWGLNLYFQPLIALVLGRKEGKRTLWQTIPASVSQGIDAWKLLRTRMPSTRSLFPWMIASLLRSKDSSIGLFMQSIQLDVTMSKRNGGLS